MKSWSLNLVLLTLCVLVSAMLSVGGKIRDKRTWIIDSFTIEEEYPGPFPYDLGVINVEKSYLLKFVLIGQGVDQEPKGLLSIEQKTGMVLVHRKVDFELYQSLKLSFEALKEDNGVDTRLGVEIKVMDINDNPPTFNSKLYEISLDESAVQGIQVMTVRAEDKDDSNTPNGTFNFRIVSITPKPEDLEFYITQSRDIGHISFNGCLDYEKARKYTILIEAKDNGNKVQLSSTGTVLVNVIDKNNHRPEITGYTGPGKIEERLTGIDVLRVQVRDRDSQGSPAWNAKFTLHGRQANYFKIRTDPVTNEGILTVLKPIDYEDQSSINVSISVENEVPYFSCKVRSRSPGNAKWDVEMITEGVGTETAFKLYPIVIAVLDVNDPPVFSPPVQTVLVMENTKPGTVIGQMKAEDPDKTFESSFRFFKGVDVDDWVTVNPATGEVLVAKNLDRESPHVKNSSYSVIMYVVDNAVPPLTGTGTLIIQLRDQNDNIPILQMNTAALCLSNNATRTNITAVDADLPPYTGPFKYELLGDVKGKWKLEPTYGMTVDLVRESSVYSGIYDLQVRVLDGQGMGMVQNLTVTVCDCSQSPNCRKRMAATAQPGLGVIGIIMLAILLLLGIFLMLLLISCKEDIIAIEDDYTRGGTLLKSNFEVSGSDCKVPHKVLLENMYPPTQKLYEYQENNISVYNNDAVCLPPPLQQVQHVQQTQNSSSAFTGQQMFRRSISRNSSSAFTGQQMFRRSISRNSSRRSYRHIQSNSYETTNGSCSVMNTNDVYNQFILKSRLEEGLLSLRCGSEELGDYGPHCYAYEGDLDLGPRNLDSISIPEDELNLEDLANLDFRFNKLATVCRPDLMQCT